MRATGCDGQCHGQDRAGPVRAVRRIERSAESFDKAARDRKLARGQKCGGRKSYAENNPELVALARRLAAERLSLRKISTELASRGYATARGVAYSASAVKAMLGRSA